MEVLQIGQYYHIYNRGNNRSLIFFRLENYSYFLNLVKKYITDIAEVHSYCLLPNHFHFLIKIKDEVELNQKYIDNDLILHQPFANLFNAYTKAINKDQNRTGSLFQRNFKKVLINENIQLQNTIIYINTNSNHHGLEDYKRYKFCSYQSLISNKLTAINKSLIELYFDDVINFKSVLEYKKETIEVLTDFE